MSYNGWSNYETWNVALWIGNEQGSSEYWSEQAQNCYDEAKAETTYTTREDNAAYALAERLKSEHEEYAEEATKEINGFLKDLLTAALSEVNWREIAENMLSEGDKD